MSTSSEQGLWRRAARVHLLCHRCTGAQVPEPWPRGAGCPVCPWGCASTQLWNTAGLTVRVLAGPALGQPHAGEAQWTQVQPSPPVGAACGIRDVRGHFLIKYSLKTYYVPGPRRR